MLIRRLGLAVLLLVTAGLRAQTLTGTAVADPAVPTVISPSVSGSDYFVLNKDLTLSGRFRAQTTQTILCPAPAGLAPASATPRSLINDATNAYFTAQSSSANVAASTDSPGYPCTSAAPLSLAGGTPTQTFATNDQRHGRYHVLEAFGGNGPDTFTVIANLNTNQSSTPTLTKSSSVTLDTNGTYTSMTTDLYSDYGLTAITQLRTATSAGGLWVYSPGIQTVFKILGPGGTPLPAIGAFIIPATANDNGDLLVLVNQDNLTSSNLGNPPLVTTPFTIIDLGQLNRAFSAVISQGTTITLPSVTNIAATTPYYAMLGATYSPVFHLLYALTAGGTSSTSVTENVIRYDPTTPSSPAETVVADVSNIPFTFGTYPQLAANAAAGTMEILASGTLYHVPVAGKNNTATVVTGTPFPDSNFKPTFIASNPLLGETYIASASQVDILTLSGSSTKRAVLELYGTDNAVVNQSYTLYANGINPSSDSDLGSAAVTFTATPAGGGTPIVLGTAPFYQFTGAPGSLTTVKFPATGIYTVVATVAATTNYPAVTSLPITVGVGTTAIAPVYQTNTRLIVPATSSSTTVTGSLTLFGSTYAPTGRIIISDATGTQVGRYNFTGGATSYPVSVTLTLPNGASTLTAAYNGDTQNQPSTSPAVNITVGTVAKVTPAMAITLPTTSSPGATVTGTLAFTSTSTSAPTGNITVTQNSSTGVSTVIATIPASQAAATGGKAFTFTAPTAPDTYNIYASYDGDTNFNLAFSPTYKLTVASNIITTTTSLSAVATATTGVAFPVTVTLKLANTSSTQPTGFVVVQATNTAGSVTILGTVTIAQATASGGYALQSTLTNPGTYSITATYNGDTTYGPSSGTISVAVKGTPAFKLAVNTTGAIGVAQDIILTLNFPGATVPSGTIFTYAVCNGVTTTVSQFAAAGARQSPNATVPFTPASVCTYDVYTHYDGDSAFTATDSNHGTVSVTAPVATTTNISAPSAPRSGIAFTVTQTLIAKATSTNTPTGNIVLRVHSNVDNSDATIATVPAATAFATGGAAATFTAPVGGSYTFSSTYAGDANFTSSINFLTINVTQSPITPVLILNPIPSVQTGSNLPVTVGFEFAVGAPTNSISVLATCSGGGTFTILIPGISTVGTTTQIVSFDNLPDCTYDVYARYPGDALYLPTESKHATAVVGGVNANEPLFKITAPASVAPLTNFTVNIKLGPTPNGGPTPTGLIKVTAAPTLNPKMDPEVTLGTVTAAQASAAGGVNLTVKLPDYGDPEFRISAVIASDPVYAYLLTTTRINTINASVLTLVGPATGNVNAAANFTVNIGTIVPLTLASPGITVTSRLLSNGQTGPIGYVTSFNAANGASVPLIFPTAGTYTVTANFPGETNNNPATSNSVTIVVAPPLVGPQITLTPDTKAYSSSGTAFVIEKGNAGSVGFTVASLAGYTSPVTLSLGGDPLYLRATITDDSGQPIKTTLTTPAGVHFKVLFDNTDGNYFQAQAIPAQSVPDHGILACTLLGAFAVSVVIRRRVRKLRRALSLLSILLAFIISSIALTGCGDSIFRAKVTVTATPTGQGASPQSVDFYIEYTRANANS